MSSRRLEEEVANWNCKNADSDRVGTIQGKYKSPPTSRNGASGIYTESADRTRAKMSFVGRCYSLAEAASRNGDDDRRNVHHIILMLQSGRPGQRCHLLGDVIPLKKQRAGMETTTEEMFIISF
ncbi:hypothetical protein CDAR_196401 [Caerostris darwini]|uniref:Uncharacterized protein n=1 Tax=Caerostris darwini TaxID=1538125 RepID=A0AAV4PVI6_9ARAC|nr:hypothetical protein CDAR_196401 [Caerostris darwini]